MGGMGGVLHDTGGFTGASCKENVQDGGERGSNDLCSCVHCLNYINYTVLTKLLNINKQQIRSLLRQNNWSLKGSYNAHFPQGGIILLGLNEKSVTLFG